MHGTDMASVAGASSYRKSGPGEFGFGAQDSKLSRSNVMRTKRAERAIAASMDIAKKVNYVDMKLKNSKRAMNIAKTIFGMVDEMDQTDFCA